MSPPPGFDCPECGARLRGGQPGRVLACAQCKNPVVVPEPAPQRPTRPAPQPVSERPSAFDPEAARRKLFVTAGGVLVLVAAAHLGLFLLLTRDARAGIVAVEARHDVADLAGARPPEGEPKPGSPEYRTWREAKARWVDAEAWRTDRRQVKLLRGGIVGSLLVQIAITGWILVRLLGKLKRGARGMD